MPLVYPRRARPYPVFGRVLNGSFRSRPAAGCPYGAQRVGRTYEGSMRVLALVSRADLAELMVRQLVDTTYLRRAVAVMG